ncbi:SdpI family protein [bacterium]|nr:SdpI family protein [bacterium]
MDEEGNKAPSQPTALHKAVDWLCWVAPLGMALWGQRAWDTIPKPEGWRGVAVHFGPDGEADRWSTQPFESVWLMPITILFVVALLTYLPAVSALPENARASLSALRWLKLLMVGWLGWLHVSILQSGTSGLSDLGGHLLLWLGVLFGVMGFIFPGIKRNAFAGIRVPWTLMHEEVWEETHRRAGGAWKGLGIVLILMDLLWGGKEAFAWGFGLMMVVAVLWTALILPFSVFKRLQREGKLST